MRSLPFCVCHTCIMNIMVDCNLAHAVASHSLTSSLAQDNSFGSCQTSTFVEWVVYSKDDSLTDLWYDS